MEKLDVIIGYLESYITNTTGLIQSKGVEGELENVDLLDIEKVDFKALDKGVAKVQRKLHNRTKSALLVKIITTLGVGEVAGAGIFIFYTCLTHWDFDRNSEESTKENIRLVAIASKVGRTLIHKYLFKTFQLECGDNNLEKKVSYGNWKKGYLSTGNNSFINTPTVAAELGCVIIDILEASELIKKEVHRRNYNEQEYIITVAYPTLIEKYGYRNVHVLPFKLPMVVPPKEYSRDNLGGFLLNDVKFTYSLIIPKNAYKHDSTLSDDKLVYKLVNGIAGTAYKVNTELLEFISNNKHLGLLLDKNVPHKFEDIEKKVSIKILYINFM